MKILKTLLDKNQLGNIPQMEFYKKDFQEVTIIVRSTEFLLSLIYHQKC